MAEEKENKKGVKTSFRARKLSAYLQMLLRQLRRSWGLSKPRGLHRFMCKTIRIQLFYVNKVAVIINLT